MKLPAYRRHDISDHLWEILEPHLPGQQGLWGGVAQDNRMFLNGVFWVLRTGSPWRDLPPEYGNWNTSHKRFRRWAIKGIWEMLFKLLSKEPDCEWIMIDASHCKVHQHAAGARGGNQDMSITKGGLNSKLHIAVDANGMPVKVLVTGGTVADCSMAVPLFEDLTAEVLIADRGYDTEKILSKANEKGMLAVIPPRIHRTEQREYDKYFYSIRHIIENTFLYLKQWRGIATRYFKTTSSFLAAVQIRCMMLWAKFV